MTGGEKWCPDNRDECQDNQDHRRSARKFALAKRSDGQERCQRQQQDDDLDGGPRSAAADVVQRLEPIHHRAGCDRHRRRRVVRAWLRCEHPVGLCQDRNRLTVSADGVLGRNELYGTPRQRSPDVTEGQVRAYPRREDRRRIFDGAKNPFG